MTFPWLLKILARRQPSRMTDTCASASTSMVRRSSGAQPAPKRTSAVPGGPIAGPSQTPLLSYDRSMLSFRKEARGVSGFEYSGFVSRTGGERIRPQDMRPIRIAIAGVGNCASSLVQGLSYYRTRTGEDFSGLMHWDVGGYMPFDIEVTAAFDIDERKVGQDVSRAIFAPPNCATRFHEKVPETGVQVVMGRAFDGFPTSMDGCDEDCSFVLAPHPEPTREDVVQVLRESGVEILLIYLPVGSEKATRFYAECALDAGVAIVNNIPVFLASDPAWASRFQKRGLPIIGDDIKSQLGATIVHRILVDLFKQRGVELDRTYQLNVGGNTDFLNMLDRDRLASKRTSKTEAVQSVAGKTLDPRNVHIGPSDYVPWLNDKKICFLRMEGRIFGNVPLDLELRLSVEDSPNSAGVAIDAIRCCKLALDRGQGGILEGPSAYYMKRPPVQYPDHQAYLLTEAFIRGTEEAAESYTQECP
jgi:myo-inositol-1-phosphate synthase